RKSHWALGSCIGDRSMKPFQGIYHAPVTGMKVKVHVLARTIDPLTSREYLLTKIMSKKYHVPAGTLQFFLAESIKPRDGDLQRDWKDRVETKNFEQLSKERWQHEISRRTARSKAVRRQATGGAC